MREWRFKIPVLLAIILFFLIYNLLPLDSLFAAQLSNRKVTISDSRASAPNVKYTYQWTGSTVTLRCFKILFCTSASGACTIPSGLNTTGSSKGTWSGLTAVNWGLDNVTNGILKLTNLTGEAAAANLSLEFLGIINPANEGTYYNRITTYSDGNCINQVDFGNFVFRIIGPGIGVTVTVPGPPPPPPPPPPGLPGPPPPPPAEYATVIFQGKASPGAYVTILRDGRVAATLTADPLANFSATLTGIPAGIWTFGIWAEDKEGRKTLTISFTVSLTARTTTTFSGIFLPPTIDLSVTKIARGEVLNIFGFTAPQAEVSVFIGSPEVIVRKTKAKGDGGWIYPLDTSIIEEGSHTARSKSVSFEGEISPFSQTLGFWVGRPEIAKCKGADLNFDGKINLIDFSILLYFWGKHPPLANPCADINRDGRVGLVDFSIMMYWWTK